MSETMKSLFKEVRGILSPKVVFGEPVVFEDKTLIPVVSVGFGVGGGGGKGKEGKEGGFGMGGGGGASPVGIIVLLKGVPGFEGVKVMKFPSAIGQIMGEVMPKIAACCQEMFAAGKKPMKEEEKKKLLSV